MCSRQGRKGGGFLFCLAGVASLMDFFGSMMSGLSLVPELVV